MVQDSTGFACKYYEFLLQRKKSLKRPVKEFISNILVKTVLVTDSFSRLPGGGNYECFP